MISSDPRFDPPDPTFGGDCSRFLREFEAIDERIKQFREELARIGNAEIEIANALFQATDPEQISVLKERQRRMAQKRREAKSQLDRRSAESDRLKVLYRRSVCHALRGLFNLPQ